MPTSGLFIEFIQKFHFEANELYCLEAKGVTKLVGVHVIGVALLNTKLKFIG
jgi:hypothetical protein